MYGHERLRLTCCVFFNGFHPLHHFCDHHSLIQPLSLQKIKPRDCGEFQPESKSKPGLTKKSLKKVSRQYMTKISTCQAGLKFFRVTSILTLQKFDNVKPELFWLDRVIGLSVILYQQRKDLCTRLLRPHGVWSTELFFPKNIGSSCMIL